jgi:23S rRNA (adenine2503-C2)-methyltransferase
VNPPSLLALIPEQLVELEKDLTIQEARKIVSLANRLGTLPLPTPAGIRRDIYLPLRDRYAVDSLVPVAREQSQLDPFVKYALRAPDNSIVETVRIPLEREGRFVACVSSQVGCAIGCAFCATGRLGMQRNLLAWEIVDQVRHIRKDLPKGSRVHGAVFQGMGEPLANVDNVIQAIHVMSNPSMLSIDMRAITVCTSGLASALPKLLSALPNVRIGLSIGSAIAEKRKTLIPLEAKQPLVQAVDLLADHAKATRIAPMFAFTLLEGVNDDTDDIEALGQLIERFVSRSGEKPRISLVRYNPIGSDDPFKPSSPERAEHFRSEIAKLGIPVVRRYSGGSDIAAACGQLGMKLMTTPIPCAPSA